MAKTKETPWTAQKVMYKDGNPEVYRKFGWMTWKRMTADERAMWTEQNEDTPAPISKEVIEFNKKIDKPAKEVVDAIVDQVDSIDPVDIEDIRAALKDKGIKFAYNSKLPTLLKKLENANNPE